MTDTARNIISMMKQVALLFNETALLLGTADDYMRRAGWTVRHNQCITISAVPEKSSNWFPHYVFHFYKSDRYKHLLPFVSVIFYDRDGDMHVEESLVSGGWHDYGKTNEPKGLDHDYELHFASWHVYMPNRRDDGTLISVDPRQVWPVEKYAVHKTTTLAIPLIDVTSSEQLKRRIIDPLLTGIQEENR